ncbi:TBC1 domain family member 10A [Oopsacas minuta]|uniref:TBC1 domain family member 10A n=1 Tax=Oopsacas minuta TaxID=111878 RepID=A0AAV7K8J0_9METZ|nr:TBC1 domain family member 10A [Oopsacas minuta]
MSTDRFGFELESEQASYSFCIPHNKLRKRESKWLKMFDKWDYYMSKKSDLIRVRCQKGIPYSLRGKAWRYLTHSYILEEQHPGLFNDLVRQADKIANPNDLSAIIKDLHRTFPANETFADEKGRDELRRVLSALAAYKPEHGYCQAMSPIVATLLMHMPAESAFWVMVRILEDYLPGYFSDGLFSLQVDCEIFGMLLPSFAPRLAAHMKSIGAVPSVILLEWFMCLFCRTLPFSCALRVIDIFMYEGPIALMKAALSLSILKMGSSYDKYSTVNEFYPAMRELSPEITHESVLIPYMFSLKVKQKQIERLHLVSEERIKQEQAATAKRRSEYKQRQAEHNLLSVSSEGSRGSTPSPTIRLSNE